MKWERLDELLGRYMTPVMVEAGFRRVGSRSYVVESADLNLVLVQVRGFAPIPLLTFVIEWAAIPRVLREFHAEGGGARPRLDWGLLNGRLHVPTDMREIPELSSEWSLDPNREFDSFGRRFEQALRAEAIPLWLSLLDREHLAKAKGFGYFDGPGLREAILYIDDGDLQQVTRWVDAACAINRHPEDTIVEWLRQRLDARRSPPSRDLVHFHGPGPRKLHKIAARAGRRMEGSADMETVDGLTHVHSGKVRDLYRTDDGRLVMVASDRISAFDYVLDSTIPDKGRILTAMTAWWFEQFDVANHLLGLDDPLLPERWHGRTMICKQLDMVPVEAVARGYLTGSGLLDYRATGEVCGIPLPPGLQDGDRLPQPIFTPATKAELGEHDENVSYEAVVQTVGDETAAELRELTLRIYERAATLARARGIILADTKFEFGLDANGRFVLADEAFTPDSSRFWPADDWRPGRAQPSFDKQYVRNWLLSAASGWDRASGAPPPPLPDDVVAATRARYVEAYERLTLLRFADWPGGADGTAG